MRIQKSQAVDGWMGGWVDGWMGQWRIGNWYVYFARISSGRLETANVVIAGPGDRVGNSGAAGT